MCVYYFGSNCLKNLFFCMIQGSYVPNLAKIGPQIMSQSWVSDWVRFNIPLDTLWVILEKAIQAITCIGTDNRKLNQSNQYKKTQNTIIYYHRRRAAMHCIRQTKMHRLQWLHIAYRVNTVVRNELICNNSTHITQRVKTCQPAIYGDNVI